MRDPLSSAAAIRTDANALAMRVVRSILDASHDFAFQFDGQAFAVTVERLPISPWPATGVDGLDPSEDGPWPAAVRLRCTWPNGAATLLMEARHVRGSSRYRHLLGIRVLVPAVRREVLWITMALPLREASNGSDVVVEASFSTFRKPDTKHENAFPLNHAARDVMARAQMPFTSDFRLEACRVRVPEGIVLPSAGDIFERLGRLALLKLPFFLRNGEGIEGGLPFEIPVAPTEGSIPPPKPRQVSGAKRAGVTVMAGGVRQYKATYDALLTEVAREPMSLDTLFDVLRDRYGVTGEVSRRQYPARLSALGHCVVKGQTISITADGEAYLANPTAEALFERMHAEFSGLLEVLVIAGTLGRADTERTMQLLCALLGVTWETPNQVSFRRNWLLSMGMVERSSDGDTLTPLGERTLEAHAEEASAIRARLDDLIDELGSDAETTDVEGELDGTSETSAGFDVVRSSAPLEPSAWGADRLDLRANMVAPFARDLELPPATIASAVAALSAGKHVLFVGPPGTGKTEIAHAIIEAARVEGYCTGGFVATASADWTTFDTIGGYSLQRSGELRFRPGALLRAIEQWQWLVLDELNRADVDRAFGEMMTILAGRTTDTAYELEAGRTVRIGPDPGATHRVPPTFRVLATMNTWDKTSLFRLSYAVQRRFAIVYVGIPEDAALASLIGRHAEKGGFDPPLQPSVTAALVDLFSSKGLLGVRPVGPAVLLDLIRYVRRRSIEGGMAVGDVVAEGVGMYVLPQLEGLDSDGASRAHASVVAGLSGWTSDEAIAALTDRFRDLFPHVKFAAG